MTTILQPDLNAGNYFFAGVIIVITIITLLGNSLVILSWLTHKSVRTPANLYIVSLAMTDFIIGIFILPTDFAVELRQDWTKVEFICKLRLIAAIDLQFISIIHLVAITYDRYRAITDGVGYIQRRSICSVLFKCGLLWLIGVWMVMPPIVEWNYESEWSGVEKGYCRYRTSTKWVLQLLVGMFYIPAVALVVFCLKIFLAIRAMLQKKVGRLPLFEMSSATETTDTSIGSYQDKSPTSQASFAGIFKKGKKSISENFEEMDTSAKEMIRRNAERIFKRERKAAKTLGVVVAAFFIFITPIYVCHHLTLFMFVNKRVFTFCAVLVHANSAVNPIIYAFCSKDFKEAFRNIVTFRFSSK